MLSLVIHRAMKVASIVGRNTLFAHAGLLPSQRITQNCKVSDINCVS